jgi:hypothetical protein
MDQNRAFKLFDPVKHRNQLADIVTVNGSHIGEIKGLEQDARSKKSLERILAPLEIAHKLGSDSGDLVDPASVSFFKRITHLEANRLLKKEESAPTFLEMDISLSFKTTIKFLSNPPAWLSPSYANPAVTEPSPMIETTWCRSRSRSLATTMPNPAEMDVEEWPTPK